MQFIFNSPAPANVLTTVKEVLKSKKVMLVGGSNQFELQVPTKVGSLLEVKTALEDALGLKVASAGQDFDV